MSYRLGKKQKRVVLDSKGIEIVVFQKEKNYMLNSLRCKVIYEYFKKENLI